jgi:hypothetical protein
MGKEKSIEEIKQIALRLYHKIFRLATFPDITVKEDYFKKKWEIDIDRSTIHLMKDGKFDKYENHDRQLGQSSTVNRNRPYIIRTREQAIQWVNYYKPLFHTPPNANIRFEFYPSRMSPNAKSPAGGIDIYLEYPTPPGYSYYWDTLRGGEKYCMFSPSSYMRIDPLDGTLVSATERWNIHPIVFRPPIVKVTKEQAIALARKIAPEELKMRFYSHASSRYALPLLGIPRAELCYKMPFYNRCYLKNGKVVFEKRKTNKQLGKANVMEFILVWSVRFGAYKETFPPCTAEVNIDAATGEVVDNGVFSSATYHLDHQKFLNATRRLR